VRTSLQDTTLTAGSGAYLSRFAAIKITNDHPFKRALSIKLICGNQANPITKLPIKKATGGGSIVEWDDLNLCMSPMGLSRLHS
jgi:hypothetical protein